MCGRYELHATQDEVLAHVGDLLAADPDARQRSWATRSYNVAPSAHMPVIRRDKETLAPRIDKLQWGFRPTWAKRTWINARSESLFTTPAFKAAATKRRCLVLATGWYEWQETGTRAKQPFYISAGRPIAFAGIWTAAKLPTGGWVLSFGIVTAPATPTLERIHPRMPLVMNPRDYAAWVNPMTDDPASLMQPFDGGALRAYAVSTHVNDPRNDDSECIAPI